MTRNEFLSQFHHFRQPHIEPDFPLQKTGRPAAVLIPLIDYGNSLRLLLTERAHHLKHHPGQISFPGGAVDSSDNTLFDAALREAEEEVGLPSSHVDVVGMLPRYRTISGYEIAPVVGFVNPDFTPVVDKNEVESVFEVPLAHVLNRKNHLVHTTHRDKKAFPIYFIPWQERMIWGATAAMLRNLSHHIHP
ncbi:CoA pyrophosphatase [Alteromonas mediterranea]|uniref:CoA pyrophosphatase n=1 Tax=Alteromonas mediterranea TaxID=314275 RepID=UPI0012F8B270|nr:CoA pyrophosphatase [Alteromonas mediterranea]QGX61899.1 CoA pyrophosphatase [Alteromonas mediterranea]